MSWLNNSLNSIKGQLTTLAQEVLAETAGPGDDEYVAPPTDAQAALEVLAESQKECEQLNKICGEKDNEIAVLRKQITELQSKISDSGGGHATAAAASSSGRTSKSPTENTATLEDSWCWEPENAKSDNDRCSETSSGNGGEMVNITLEEVPLAGGGNAGQRVGRQRGQRQSPEHTAEMQRRIGQLEEENKQLNGALEELDAQHNQAMQKVLELKTDLQGKLNAVNKDYEALKREHAEKFINGELELGRLKKQVEKLEEQLKESTAQKEEWSKRSQNQDEELRKAMVDLADLQSLLEKRDKDNVELIERIREANRSNEAGGEERRELNEKLKQLQKELDELKTGAKEKKHSESSTTGSSGKQSEDEFIVVREADAGSSSSGPSTPPSKEELKDKIVQLENRLSELTLETGSLSLKLQDSEMEKELATNVLKANLQELQAKLDARDEELAEQREKIEQLKEQAAEGIIVQERLKVVIGEKEKLEADMQKLEVEKQKLEANWEQKMQETRVATEELQQRLLLAEQEKEWLQLEAQAQTSQQERIQELEQKLQTRTYENQQLKLNAEAEIETLNNSAELEDKIKALAEENESMRHELESIAHAKFSEAIAEEKRRVTDLDADEDEEPFDHEKLRQLLANYFKQDLSQSPAGSGDQRPAEEEVRAEWEAKTFKALSERLWQVDALEKNLAQVSEEVLDLQDQKMVWDHEKKTLEADISQYILQCDELVKNNEILLNELDNYKRNKLETIHENNEENMLQLESQLEECTKLNRTLEQEYAELNEKIDELEREKQELTERLRETQTANEVLQRTEEDFRLQLQTLELEKQNLQTELKSRREVKEDEDAVDDVLAEAQSKCSSLESQLERLSKDHADLVAAMQAQKTSLLEAHKKRDDLERIVREHELLASRTKQEFVELTEQLRAKDEALAREREALADERNQVKELAEQREELQQDLLAKDIIAETLKSELKGLQDQSESLRATNALLQKDLEEANRSVEKMRADLDEEVKRSELRANEVQSLREAKETLQADLQRLETEKKSAEESREKNPTPESETQADSTTAVAQIAKLEAELLATADLQKTVESLTFEKNEMIKALQQKHAENMQYYMEIQRLQPILQQLQQQLATASSATCAKCPELEAQLGDFKKEQEKLHDQISFLKEKSDILTTNLLTEQTNQRAVQQEKRDVEEQNAAIRKDLERLREHLLEVEDLHTQESVELQRELEETRAQMIAMQEEVSKSSNAYTSASIRANQHAETLQAQYALVVQQRDDLVAKLSSAEDRESRNQAALCNLQCALEQFQNDKENDIKAATQRIRKELQQELVKEAQLKAEVAALNQQLADANQGLRAASRLSDQLEACQLTIAALREEVETLKSHGQSLEQQLSQSESSQTDKIDKNLIKSLLIGYVVSGNPNDKTQVLRMISSVLDFTQGESDKVGLNKQQTSWLGAILGGAPAGGGTASHSKDNLVQAFVQFLEQESQPKVNANNMPNLLNMTQTSPSTTATTTSAADTTTVGVSRKTSLGSNNGSAANSTPIPIQPLLLNSNVIDDFAPSRNSSSILKDILSDS